MLPMSALNQPHYGECLDEVDGSHEYFSRLHHPDHSPGCASARWGFFVV